MSKIAFVFPGQGSQKTGMAADFIGEGRPGAQFREEADGRLGFGLGRLMLEGPQEELTLTYNAQPALLTAGAAIDAALKSAGIRPDYTAGHSLGEYTALVSAGVLGFGDAAETVHRRGLYMNDAVPAGEGAMAAILGLNAEELRKVTENITESGEPVQPANLNCPGQIVISGSKAGVERACEAAKEAGAKRAIPLDVSGPFHSVLMKPAASELQVQLDSVTFNEPVLPVVSNVTAKPVTDPAEMKRLLVEQLYSPVRWEESVREMIGLGVTLFIECGPGGVLSGLIRKIDRSVTVLKIEDAETLDKAVEAAKGWS
ncbi:ACP S-malonyltransferase [Edaphobacillus lindanitolerans]|uniref:Malonyl CoA-acyl carrier protein transacylase n=1 Tax=Edaphobacillus lindanitolerans TaxID=550447 RepID=A0A1U7PLG7_9BACI|nr:ACP S-malonyltransferase [Edaphobacillus lindanitolerans]SIT67521.1 [acyl-carrier-protein] S-malonyltransferase [Edaphobacillus lindanitolerans]